MLKLNHKILKNNYQFGSKIPETFCLSVNIFEHHVYAPKSSGDSLSK